jgi:uncharacterized protein YjbI with pentapeptide repeats
VDKNYYINLLSKGQVAWNEWRITNPGYIDLSGVNLSTFGLWNTNLSNLNLSKANLNGARLENANLQGVNLTGATLVGANLAGANLSNSIMRSCNLQSANMPGVHLNNVILEQAFLEGACLIMAELRNANLVRTCFNYADMRSANLTGANLSNAYLNMANLSRTNATGAIFNGVNAYAAILYEAKLSGVSAQKAIFGGADFSDSILSQADLTGANLEFARLTGANFESAILEDCEIYGISAWDLNLNNTIQKNLKLTKKDQPTITVDNLEVAQFMYLLLYNEKVRHVIDTLTAKVVLILGRFSPERKEILDSAREKLKEFDYLPIMFDFEKPASRDFTETVRTLAHLAKFIIADLTDPRSIPQELQAIVPHLQIPVQPLIHESQREYGMFQDLLKYPWVLETVQYSNCGDLMNCFEEKIIKNVEAAVKRTGNYI